VSNEADAGVYLRPLASADADAIHRWHNDSKLYSHLVGSFRRVERAAVDDWLAARQTARDEVNLAICRRLDDLHIGNAYLRDIDRVARRAELHIFIGDREQRGRGYGYEAIRLLCEHAFSVLRLHRLYLFVLDRNAAAIRTYEKCGFVLEGRLRDHAFKDGRFHDVLVMGRCANAA
jgi:diamine N-acetyltransferase